MASILNEDDIAAGLSGSEQYWVYNALDCCVTEEVRDVLARRLALDPRCNRTYHFELSCQAPALAMMLRGAAFDEAAASKGIREWQAEEVQLTASCCRLIGPYWGDTEQRKGKCDVDSKPHRWTSSVVVRRKAAKDAGCTEAELPVKFLRDDAAHCIKCARSRLVASHFNPLSASQVIKLLYTNLALPVQHSRKGERGITSDDEALDRLMHAKGTEDDEAEILRNILDVRKAHKQIGFLKSRRSADGRLRSSVNVGATETGRWSASKDPFREGTNVQNIADRSRNVIVADPGLWLGYADLEQAESKIIAYDAECPQDIEDHESGNTHIGLCRSLFPELPWGSGPDKEIAQTKLPWNAEHDYYRVAKIVRHGTNIAMSGQSLAREIHSKKARGDELREGYFARYPENLRRQNEIKAQVREHGILITPLERKRQFFGRLWDAGTQREGLAQTQQGTVADLLNLALRRIWRELDGGVNIFNSPRPSDPNRVWLLAQVHDAILFLIRPHDIATLRRVLELMTIPIMLHGRLCTIGTEVQIGTNFRHFDAKRADTVGGLASWKVEGDKIRVFNTKEDLKCV